jgi:hypothetical protein
MNERINNAERAFGLLTVGGNLRGCGANRIRPLVSPVRLRTLREQPSPQASPLVLEFDSSTRTGDCLPQLEFNSSVPASSKLRRAAGSGQPEPSSGFRPLNTQNYFSVPSSSTLETFCCPLTLNCTVLTNEIIIFRS